MYAVIYTPFISFCQSLQLISTSEPIPVISTSHPIYHTSGTVSSSTCSSINVTSSDDFSLSVDPRRRLDEGLKQLNHIIQDNQEVVVPAPP